NPVDRGAERIHLGEGGRGSRRFRGDVRQEVRLTGRVVPTVVAALGGDHRRESDAGSGRARHSARPPSRGRAAQLSRPRQRRHRLQAARDTRDRPPARRHAPPARRRLEPRTSSPGRARGRRRRGGRAGTRTRAGTVRPNRHGCPGGRRSRLVGTSAGLARRATGRRPRRATQRLETRRPRRRTEEGANMSDERPLTGKIALVAGATRGAGRAIAVELARAGAYVYATGRSSRVNGPSEIDRPETIEETGERMAAAGGEGVALRVDHL